MTWTFQKTLFNKFHRAAWEAFANFTLFFAVNHNLNPVLPKYNFMRSKKLLFLFSILFTGSALWAQDIHFTQFYMSPMTTNPANAGKFEGTARIGGIFRGQWASVQNVAKDQHGVRKWSECQPCLKPSLPDTLIWTSWPYHLPPTLHLVWAATNSLVKRVDGLPTIDRSFPNFWRRNYLFATYFCGNSRHLQW